LKEAYSKQWYGLTKTHKKTTCNTYRWFFRVDWLDLHVQNNKFRAPVKLMLFFAATHGSIALI
jgi:hypothetical protein